MKSISQCLHASVLRLKGSTLPNFSDLSENSATLRLQPFSNGLEHPKCSTRREYVECQHHIHSSSLSGGAKGDEKNDKAHVHVHMDDDLNMQPDLRHLRQKVGLRPLTISKIRRLSTEAHDTSAWPPP